MTAMPQPDALSMSEVAYLAFEDESKGKHEYASGKVYAMTGASLRHNLIVNNTVASLVAQLADKPCIVPNNDTRVRVASMVSHRYPDITVICGSAQYYEKRVDTITNPIVLLEVLSPSTALTDRNEKLDEYTRIPSLQEYVLISQDAPKIERFLRRDEAAHGDWLYTKVTDKAMSLALPSIDCVLALHAVYAKLDLTEDK